MIDRYPDSQSICDAIELVTSVTLGLSAHPIERPASAWSGSDQLWTAAVGVAGAFRGAVAVSCTKGFAYRATRAMLDTDEVDDACARDVLGELANVIGGNIKSMLASLAGGDASLSIPTVTEGCFHVAGATTVHEQWCDLGGDLIVVTLFERSQEVS